MSYPGSQAISPEVQQRIRSTFEQTLGLAEKGQRQQAALGCDFILQLDPAYRPAQALQQRLAAGGEGAVEVEDLRALVEGRPSAEERAAEAQALFEETRPGLEDPTAATPATPSDLPVEEEDPFDLDDLPDLPLPEADLLGDPEPAPPEDASPPAPTAEESLAAQLPDELPPLAFGDEGSGEDHGSAEEDVSGDAAEEDLGLRLRAAVEERRFADALELAQAHQAAVVADPELARLATLAGERQEAEAYVERFVAAATEAEERGEAERAAALRDKARALEPSHPALRHPALAVAADPVGPEADPGDATMAAAGVTGALADETPGEDDPLDLGGFDFGSGDEEGDRRISELLDDGQSAFDRADYQAAIDSWSRIFLIDIDHAEASNRIEEARRLKNEEDRRVEEIYHEAVRAAEQGREAEAREGFETVLTMAPGYAAARDQLERLDIGETPPPRPVIDLPADADPEATIAASSVTGGEDAEPLREQIMIPPDPGEDGAATVEGGVEGPKGRTMVAGGGLTSPRFLLIAGLVLVVVLAAAYFLYEQRELLFPNAGEAATAPAAQVDPVARATSLHESGKTGMAINLLRRLPPTAPRYEEAQALISQWQAETEPEEEAPPPSDAPEPVAVSQDDLIADAGTAAEAGEFLLARDLLTEARALGELPREAQSLEVGVDGALQPLAEALDLIELGEYTRALPDLWRRHEANPDNQDVRRLITDGYYNLAIRALQQGDAETAAEHLEEAVEMSPAAGLERHLRFAQTYSRREKDLLYRIYVKYMPAR